MKLINPSPMCRIFLILFSVVAGFSSAHGQKLRPGDVYVTEQNNSYKIEGFLGAGGGGRVYRASSPSHGIVALKITRTDIKETPKILELKNYVRILLKQVTGRTLANLPFSEMATVAENMAMDTAKRHAINHAAILERGRGYSVKKYLGETTGEVYLKSLTEPLHDLRLLQLKRFFKSMIDKGLGPLDFKPPNVMWSGSDWYLVDSMAIWETNDTHRAEKMIERQFKDDWMILVNQSVGAAMKSYLFGSDAFYCL